MKWRVPGQEVDQRKLGERLWNKTAEHVDWIRRMPWFVVDGESRLGWLMTTMSVSGWMFLLVPAHPGCPGQIPQSRKTVLCVYVFYQCYCVWNAKHLFLWIKFITGCVTALLSPNEQCQCTVHNKADIQGAISVSDFLYWWLICQQTLRQPLWKVKWKLTITGSL